MEKDVTRQIAQAAWGADKMRGEVLRAWRTFAGLTNAGLARRAGILAQSVHCWEKGTRTWSPTNVTRIADALPISDPHREAFEGMVAAAGSVAAGMSRTEWWHNFPVPAGPVWAWARTPGQEIRGRAWWGDAFQGRLDHPPVTGGVIVKIPVSIPNPPLWVTLDEPGWVDFGRGDIPESVAQELGIDLVDGVDLMNVSAATWPETGDALDSGVASDLPRLRFVASQVGVGWKFIKPHLGIHRTNRVPHAMDGSSMHSGSAHDTLFTTTSGVGRRLSVSGEEAKRLRRTKGLERPDVVAKINRLDPSHPVDIKMLEHFEDRNSLPAVEKFVSRLDVCYEADGRLGLEVVRNVAGPIRQSRLARRRRTHDVYSASFPPYWGGPIWVFVDSREAVDSVNVHLTWGRWARSQNIRPGNAITTRKAFALPDPAAAPVKDPQLAEASRIPLVVEVSKGCTVRVGTGALSTALDINRAWWPSSTLAAVSLFRENLGYAQQALKRSTQHRRPGQPQGRGH